MIKVALVGNIASGKSTVEKYLKELNFKVLDTDKVCHAILDDCNEVKLLFSSFDILDDNGKISREKVGKIVFEDYELKAKLEAIIYPNLKIKINEFFAESSNEKMVFVAIPLLFEAGMENLFDKILFVYCDDEIRQKRLILRNGYTLEYAQKRMKSQLSQDLKIKKADFVIYNNRALEELKSAVLSTIEQIR